MLARAQSAICRDRHRRKGADTVSKPNGWFPRMTALLWRLLPCSLGWLHCRTRQQRLHSIDRRLRRDLVHRNTRLLRHELGPGRYRIALQNERRGVARPPVKRIGRTKENYLRRG